MSDTAEAWVIRRGKIFEVGRYPDRQFEMTPEELAAAAAAFTPVPVNLSHAPSVLDGKVGHLQAVEVADDGRTLLGTVAIPKWLDSLLDDTGRKVSCEWDRATKQLRGLALVNQPRVPDAALMAAFAESELADFAGRLDPERRRRLLAQTPLGQQVLREEGHDSQQVAAFAAPPAKPFDPELADLDRRLAALEQRSRESGLTPARRRQLLEASEVGRAVLKAETEAEWVKRAGEEDERADRLPRLVQELRADGRPGRTSLVWPTGGR